MTTLFFLFSLLFGLLAWNVYYPARKMPIVSLVSFGAGWLVGELALHQIAAQLFIVFLFAWGGAIDGFFGALGLVICVASWLALGYHHLCADRAAKVVETALTTALGDDYRQSIRPEYKARFPTGPDRRRLLLPFAIGRDIEIIKNLPFGHHDQYLDVYRPRHPLSKAPVLFQIHGGAWTEKMGSKNEQALPLMAHMARRDWICVAADYRLSPTATFPEHIIDCKEALAWIRDKIADFGGDPDFVVVTGGSAGGHLSALLALTANDPVYQPGFEEVDTSVRGAVPFYGIYDFTNSEHQFHGDGPLEMLERSIMKLPLKDHPDVYEAASPLFRIHADAPPFFVIHGSHDSLVPVEEGRLFATRLREGSKAPVAFAEIEGAQHGFDLFASPRSEHVKHGVERFLAWLESTQR